MGCDIHLHQEVKLDGKWEHYRAAEMKRDYAAFAKMAGVRGDETPISLPRGLPEDATTLTKYSSKHWGRDGHSHSWLDANEILELEEWMKARLGNESWRLEMDVWGYFFGNSWGGFKKYPNDQPDGIEDVRFIFWFDN